MKLASPVVALPIVFIALAASAQTVGGTTSDQATSSIEVELSRDAASARIVNRDFVFDSRLSYGADHPRRLIVEITTDTTQRDDAEGYAGARIGASAWEITAEGRRSLWTLNEEGNAAEVVHDEPLFLVRQSGCCGSRDSYALFNLYSGKPLFTATGDNRSEAGALQPWAVLEVPNSGGLERLIAFHAAYSATDQTAFSSRQDVVGLLTYAAPDKPLARYRFIATGGAVDPFMGGSTVVLQQEGKTETTTHLTLWPADGKKDPKAIGGFTIRVQLTDDSIIVVPVAADWLDIAGASLPAGLSVEAVPIP